LVKATPDSTPSKEDTMAARKNVKTARSRGTIVAKGPNKWLVRVYRGLSPEGKRLYDSKTVTGLKRDAEKELTRLLSDMDSSSYVKPSRETLGEYLEAWLAAKTGVAVRTLNEYRDRIRADVIPYLGHAKMSEVPGMGLQFQTLFRELVESPKDARLVRDGRKALSPRTVQATHVVLKQALDDAVHWNRLARNPTTRIDLPKVHRRKKTVLTGAQVGTLLAWAEKNDPQFHPLWVLLLTTGMRPGEAGALRWGSLRTDAEGTTYATVSAAVKLLERGSFVIEDMPKNEGSVRSISLPESTVAVLQKHKARQAARALQAGAAYERSDLIFANDNGGILDQSKIRKRWKLACRRAGVPEVRLYDTRHTHATALLLAGVNAKVVSERLGHSTIKLTLDTYSDVLPEMREDTAKVVQSLFFGT
jgi:integrase